MEFTPQLAADLIRKHSVFVRARLCDRAFTTGPDVCHQYGTMTGELPNDHPYAALHSAALIEITPHQGESRNCRLPAFDVALTEKGRRESANWKIMGEFGQTTRWELPVQLTCAHKELLEVAKVMKVQDRPWEERVAEFHWRWSSIISGKTEGYRPGRPAVDILQADVEPELLKRFPPAPGKTSISKGSARFRIDEQNRWFVSSIDGYGLDFDNRKPGY